MLTQAINPMTGKNTPTTIRKYPRTCRLFARRLMLSISLIAFSPEAILNFDNGKVNWIGEAQALSENEAQAQGPDLFSDLASLEDETLEKQRGGFAVAGFEIDIGVSISTIVDGIIEVSTNYSLNTEKGFVNLGSEIKKLTQNVISGLKENIQSETKDAVSDIQEMTDSKIVDPVTVANPVTFSISEGSGYDNNMSSPVETGADATNTINTSASAPAVATATATGSDITPSDTMSASADVPAGTNTSASAPAVATAAATGSDITPSDVMSASAELPTNTNADTSAPAVATATVTGSDITPSDVMSASADLPTDANSETSTPETLVEIIHQTQNGHVTLLTNRLNNVSVKQTVTMNIAIDNFSQIKEFARLQQDISLITRQISLFNLRH